MGKDSFDFKRFTIKQDSCAMKVGTDGVLLGAWANIPGEGMIADIGTGTGLLAIMAAQKSTSSNIVGIEIDIEAAQQAEHNMKKSPWKDRLSVVCSDVNDFYHSHQAEFDCILSNPPFFIEDIKSSKKQRCTARHTDSLSFKQLAIAVSVMLKENGSFCVILPYTAAQSFIAESINANLKLKRRTNIITKAGAEPKRVMMEFVKGGNIESTEHSQLALKVDNEISEEYKNLTKDFYL